MKFLLFTLIINYILAVRLREEEKKPILMNVTYEYPYRDLEEEQKYLEEHLKYIQRVKEIEKKFNQDMDLMRMMVNVQNSQIQKLSEIIGVNAALIKQLEVKTLPKA